MSSFKNIFNLYSFLSNEQIGEKQSVCTLFIFDMKVFILHDRPTRTAMYAAAVGCVR